MRRMDLHRDRKPRGRPRPAHDGGWAEAFAPAACLVTECGGDLPAGFAAHGTGITEYDSESDLTFAREEWVVMEKSESERASSKGMCHDQV